MEPGSEARRGPAGGSDVTVNLRLMVRRGAGEAAEPARIAPVAATWLRETEGADSPSPPAAGRPAGRGALQGLVPAGLCASVSGHVALGPWALNFAGSS